LLEVSQISETSSAFGDCDDNKVKNKQAKVTKKEKDKIYSN